MPFEPRFKTLIDIYQHSVKKFPTRELFGTKQNGEWVWVTYAEFEKAVDAFRGALSNLGVGKGDAVAIISNNRVEWAVAAYATYGLAGSFVPMYEAQLPKEWEFIARDCGAKVLICANDGIVAKAKGFLSEVESLGHIVSLEAKAHAGEGIWSYSALLAEGKTAAIVTPAPEDVAGLIYTSGTTGNPKGVILTHLNLASNVSAIHEVFPMEQADRSLSFLPWAHSFGQTCELHGLFSMGASTAFAEAVEKIVDNLAEVQPTLLFSVPRIFNKIYAGVQKNIASKPGFIQSMVKTALRVTAKRRAEQPVGFFEGIVFSLTDKIVFSKVRAKFGGKLKYAFSGGAAISREVAEFIDTLGVTVYEGYGLTETSPIATANWPGNRKIGSVGKAIPGVRVEIDKDTAEKRPAEGGKPERLEGEIVVHGLAVMKGYHQRPEENAAVFTENGGFRTGDMGYIDDKGFVYITGRIKEQYKLENGKYVVPTPIEEGLKLSPFVLNAMVYGDNRLFNVALVAVNMDNLREWGSKLGKNLPSDPKAMLEGEDVRALMADEIKRCSAELKGFEEIRDFALIAEDFTTQNGLLTPSMKLKRREVMKVYGHLIEAMYAKKGAAKAASATA